MLSQLSNLSLASLTSLISLISKASKTSLSRRRKLLIFWGSIAVLLGYNTIHSNLVAQTIWSEQEEQAPPAQISEQSKPIYNKDRTQYAFWIAQGTEGKMKYQMVWVVNGKRIIGPEFNFVWDVDFRPDGKQIAYAASLGPRPGPLDYFIVLADEYGSARTEKFTFVSHPIYAQDGRSLTFRSQDQERRYRMVHADVSGKTLRVGTPYPFILDQVMSPAGTRWAYWAEIQKRVWRAVISDENTDRESQVFVGPIDDPVYSPNGQPTFSADGKHVFYRALDAQKGIVLVKDHEIQKE